MNPILLSARPLENHNYKIYGTLGIKLLNRLRLNFSHQKERKFGHNIADTINPFVNAMFLFPWNWDNFPFSLRCRNSTIYCTTLMNELSNIGNTITSLKQNSLLNIILYENKNFDSNSNQSILTATIESIKYTKQFNEPLSWAVLLTILGNPGDMVKHDLRVTS